MNHSEFAWGAYWNKTRLFRSIQTIFHPFLFFLSRKIPKKLLPRCHLPLPRSTNYWRPIKMAFPMTKKFKMALYSYGWTHPTTVFIVSRKTKNMPLKNACNILRTIRKTPLHISKHQHISSHNSLMYSVTNIGSLNCFLSPSCTNTLHRLLKN